MTDRGVPGEGKSGPVSPRSWVCQIKEGLWVHHATLGCVRPYYAAEIHAKGESQQPESRGVGAEGQNPAHQGSLKHGDQRLRQVVLGGILTKLGLPWFLQSVMIIRLLIEASMRRENDHWFSQILLCRWPSRLDLATVNNVARIGVHVSVWLSFQFSWVST